MFINGKQVTKCEFVTEEIKNRIINGVYKLGDKLPVEADLCEDFGVSRVTVREALKKLNMMGMIDIKQGKGTFVKSVDLGNFIMPLYQMIDFEEINIDVIFSAKKYIEGGTAHLAAENRTEKELETLERILNELKQSIENDDFMEIMRCDDEFHMQVARSAHNPILSACLQRIEEINVACLKRCSKFFTMLDDCYAQHLAIYEAIAEQDPEKAELAIVAHTESSRSVLLG